MKRPENIFHIILNFLSIMYNAKINSPPATSAYAPDLVIKNAIKTVTSSTSIAANKAPKPFGISIISLLEDKRFRNLAI